MYGRIAMRLLLTALSLAAATAVLIPGRSTTLALDVERDAGGYSIQPQLGHPLPEGLAKGDRVLLSELPVETRAAIFGQSALALGAELKFIVLHEGQRREVIVAAQKTPDDDAAFLSQIISVSVIATLLVLGLLTLWRGRDLAAAGLCLFALGIVLRVGLEEAPHLPVMPGFWAGEFGRVLMSLSLAGLYVVAYGLVGESPRPAIRRFSLIGYTGMVVLQMAWTLVRDVVLVLYGRPTPLSVSQVPQVLSVSMLVWPLAVLAIGYRRADTERRLRIRWILWSTGLLVLSVIGYVSIHGDSWIKQTVLAFAQMLAFCGYVYAVLRTRLVDVSFVVDRALAYTATSSIVIGAFALLENWLQQTTVGNNASLLLQAGSTLLLALVLRRLHTTVEHWVDRVFFRRQRRTANGLKKLARDSGFVESEARLVELVVDEVQKLVGGFGVAIYERSAAAYQRRASRGQEFPVQVDPDDRALIAMRADGREADLQGLDSRLGGEAYAFAMSAHGLALGALVCGTRRGEQFASDEREALAEVARETAAAIYRLRSREQERFVAAIAAGALDAATARRHAEALQTVWQTRVA